MIYPADEEVQTTATELVDRMQDMDQLDMDVSHWNFDGEELEYVRNWLRHHNLIAELEFHWKGPRLHIEHGLEEAEQEKATRDIFGGVLIRFT